MIDIWSHFQYNTGLLDKEVCRKYGRPFFDDTETDIVSARESF